MKSLLTACLLAFATGAVANPTPLCHQGIQGDASMTSWGESNFVILHVNNATAKMLYDKMTDIAPERYGDSSAVSSRKVGERMTCFEQIMSSGCGIYQCNLPFNDMQVGGEPRN